MEAMQRRGVIGLVVVCVLGASVSASADDPSIWDRTYKPNGMDNSSTCPGSLHDVTVKNGRFSIPWEMKYSDKAILVGHIDGTVRKLRLGSERVIKTVERHANTSAASVPLALAEGVADGRIKEGQLILVEAIGGGLAWGAGLVRW